MSYKQLCWVWLTACWLSMMGKRDVLVTASVLQPSLSLSLTLLKDIYKEHPISLSLPPLSPEMPYWVNCIILHIPRSAHSFSSIFAHTNTCTFRNHTLYLKDVAEFLIYLEWKLILKMERRSLHSPLYGGGKFDLTGGLSRRRTCVLTAGVTGWLNNIKTS